MSDCPMEMCPHWTGHGCACELMDVDPDFKPFAAVFGDDAESLLEALGVEDSS